MGRKKETSFAFTSKIQSISLFASCGLALATLIFLFPRELSKTLEVSAGSLLTSVLPEIPFTSILLSELKQLFYNICYRFQLHLCIISHPLLLSGFTGPITNLIYFVTDSRSVGHPLPPHALRIISKNHPKESS